MMMTMIMIMMIMDADYIQTNKTKQNEKKMIIINVDQSGKSVENG